MFLLCLNKQPLCGPVPTFISVNMAVWEEAVATPAMLALIWNQICVGKLGAACCAWRLPCIFYEQDNEMCRNVNMIRAAKQFFFFNFSMCCVWFIWDVEQISGLQLGGETFSLLCSFLLQFFTKTRHFGIIYHPRANITISPYYFDFPPRFRVQSSGSVWCNSVYVEIKFRKEKNGTYFGSVTDLH